MNITQAQSIVEKVNAVINKILSTTSIRYDEIDINKNPATEDTTIDERKSIYVKNGSDSSFGYSFKINWKEIEGLYKGNTACIYYDRKDVVNINFTDSSYEFDNDYYFENNHLFSRLKYLHSLVAKNPLD